MEDTELRFVIFSLLASLSKHYESDEADGNAATQKAKSELVKLVHLAGGDMAQLHKIESAILLATGNLCRRQKS